jgi:hypothetical protein
MGRNKHHFDMSKPENRAKARVAFKMHFAFYVMIISFLWVLSIITGSIWRHPWPIYPMFGWGIGLIGHFFAAYQLYDNLVEHELKKGQNATPSVNESAGQYLADSDDDNFELKHYAEKEKIKQPRENDFI